MSDYCPEPQSRSRRYALLGVLLLVATRVAAGPTLEDFTQHTWQQWLKELPRPAIVVFSTTYCPTCPQVFSDLAESVRKARTGVPLITVVMDAEGQRDLPHLKHYRYADRIFVFRGPEAALRFSVDPQWRGVTPYVALFAPQAAPQMSAGKPDAEALRALLERR